MSDTCPICGSASHTYPWMRDQPAENRNKPFDEDNMCYPPIDQPDTEPLVKELCGGWTTDQPDTDAVEAERELILIRKSTITAMRAELDEALAMCELLARHSVDCHWERASDDPRGQVEFKVERLPDVAAAILDAAREKVRNVQD